MKIHDIIRYTHELAPYETAEEWDNVGLLVGAPDTQVSRVLLALDITPAVVEEAHRMDAQLIISHHPVIFDPITALSPDSAAYLLARYGIAALCLHTNLDRAAEGVNTALGRALGLKNTKLYPEDFILTGEPETPCDADAFAAFIKDKLGAPSVRYTPGRVSRVAVSSGGGGDGVELCAKYGCDAFVTGELKHHHYNEAVSRGIAAFDAGHFPTEDVVIRPLRELLAQAFPDVAFSVSEVYRCPYRAV